MNFTLPYSFIYVLIFLLGIVPPLPQISGYTHWIVTQHGMIEPIATSYYHLREPWNLVKLLHQQRNLEFVQHIELQLNRVSNDLQANHDYQTEVQRHYVDSDSRCVKASRLLSQFDLHSTHVLTLEAKGIASSVFLNLSLLSADNRTIVLQQPICQSIFKRDFSMCCFEHLAAVRNRSSIVGVPEISLYKLAMPPQLTPDEYGHLVAVALHADFADPARNWVLYNMAAFYWRVKGRATSAIECLRAALHTSPWRHQDVALVSLANVLHLARAAAAHDAVVLMENAALVSPQFASHQLILGNIYASIGRFNESLRHYQRAAALYTPGSDKMPLREIEERIFAARCSHELSAAIAEQQRQLNRQLAQLEAFQVDTDRFQLARASVDHEVSANSSQHERHRLYEVSLTVERRVAAAVDSRCVIVDGDTQQQRACDPAVARLLAEAYRGTSSPLLMPHNESLAVGPISGDGAASVAPPVATKPNPGHQRSDMHESLCQQINCAEVRQRVRHIDAYLSVYLSPASKAFDLEGLLTHRQGLAGPPQQHPLPWHPPICQLHVNQSDLDPVDVVDGLESLTPQRQQHFVKQLDNDPSMHADSTLMVTLLQLLRQGGVEEEEDSETPVGLDDVGQRIVTAIQRRLVPQWVMLNIAGLYWRVVGHLPNALQCYRLAVKLCPMQYRDVPLVNLAVILARLQVRPDALRLIKVALQIDYSPLETHIVAAGLYNEQEKFHLALHHLAIAIRQQPAVAVTHFDMDFLRCRQCNKYRRSNATRMTAKRNKALRHNVTQVR